MDFKELFNKLESKKVRLSTIESLTGGGFAYFFTAIPGSSKVFEKGIVTYSNEAKIGQGVLKETIEEYGAVSLEVAEEMAETIVDGVSISFTGNAGPGAMDDEPVGKCFIGVNYDGQTIAREYKFFGTRSEIREQAINSGLEILEEIL